MFIYIIGFTFLFSPPKGATDSTDDQISCSSFKNQIRTKVILYSKIKSPFLLNFKVTSIFSKYYVTILLRIVIEKCLNFH